MHKIVESILNDILTIASIRNISLEEAVELWAANLTESAWPTWMPRDE